MWIVTREIYEKNQDGEYFVAAYYKKPGFQQLRNLLPDKSDATIERLTRGGGIHHGDDEWFHLIEVREGECYC